MSIHAYVRGPEGKSYTWRDAPSQEGRSVLAVTCPRDHEVVVAVDDGAAGVEYECAACGQRHQAVFVGRPATLPAKVVERAPRPGAKA